MNYDEYIKSNLWRKRRYSALERVGFRCELCGEVDSLEVHHKTYERLGNEDPGDLVVLCKIHHWKAHHWVDRRDVVARVTNKSKECSYVVGINRKKNKLRGLYFAMGTINWTEREEIRIEIEKLEKSLDKHYRRGNCSMCPHLLDKRLPEKTNKRLSNKEKRALRREKKRSKL